MIKKIVLTFVVLATLVYLFIPNQLRCETKISEFGNYCGYSEARFDGIHRSSQYIDLTPSQVDGTGPSERIAIDVLRPTQDGLVVNEAMPVIYLNTVYLRATNILVDGEITDARLYGFKGITKLILWLRATFIDDGHIIDQSTVRPWVAEMIRHGYVVVASDAPGTGASFGTLPVNYDAYSVEAAMILDWIVDQPWSNGKIGAMGQSYVGMTALATAASGHESLKAIYPSSVGFDPYNGAIFPGGIYNLGFNAAYIALTSELDDLAVSVDEDHTGDELRLAQTDRENDTFSLRVEKQLQQMPYFDSQPPAGTGDWQGMATYPLFEAINKSQIPVYFEGGWQDMFSRGTLMAYENITGPKKIRMRQWHHRYLSSDRADLNTGAETHRWFDYWLKGINNGVMDEAPIHYYVQASNEVHPWQTAEQWPIKTTKNRRFYLSSETANSVASLNDGSLSANPSQQLSSAKLDIDPSATSGINSRWNGVLGNGIYAEQQTQDEKGLTYTSQALEENITLIGHPVLKIWLSSEFADADIFVYLEDVAPDGSSHYITESTLRASHRTRAKAPYKNFNLPYYSHKQADVTDLPANVPVELELDLLPTAYQFNENHKIRLSIRGSDADNFRAPAGGAKPFSVLEGGAMASYINLPLAVRRID